MNNLLSFDLKEIHHELISFILNFLNPINQRISPARKLKRKMMLEMIKALRSIS